MKDRFNLLLALAFLAVVALLGGASRADAMSQLPLRLAALSFLVAGLWSPNRVRLARSRPLFVLAGLVVLLPTVQLIPLPYDLWASLPGHGFYTSIVDTAGLSHHSRPLSLVPGATWNALLSLLVPLAMLVLAAQVPAERLPVLATAVLVLAFVSLVLGHAQIAGGAHSALRYYRITNGDSMVGVFANRNHHAVLLAMAIPILFALPIGLRRNQTWRRVGPPFCVLGVLLIAATLLLAGSRAGLITGAVGGIAGTFLYGSMGRALESEQTGRRPKDHGGRFAWIGALHHPYAASVLAVLGIAVATVAFATTPAMQRLLRTNAAEEDRAKLFEPLMELVRSTFPAGGGFGSFESLYQRFEPVEMLRPVYLNHAHNDLIEIASDGGVGALLLLAGFLVWWTIRVVAAWRQPSSVRLSANLGRIASITTGIALLASLVDYPLRTPLHMAVFVIGCLLLQRSAPVSTRAAD